MNQELVAASVFLGTYFVLAIGRLPGFRVDRTGAAIIGAEVDFSLLVLFVGLFIVIAGIEKTTLPSDALAYVSCYGRDRPAVLSAVVSILVGNLTVLGSVANLIVVQRAKRQAAISFREYFKVGLPLTIISITVGVLLL